ncbi:MAG: polysaccharide deacetylase family protein [Clostridiales bacterium]|nr:polysaccharide deacetylase family protein [Clostridiales bacterium]
MYNILQNANACCMYRYFCAILLSACLFFLPCCSGKKANNLQFNVYMPPSFDDFFEEIIPLEGTPNSQNPIWDVSDIDISYIQQNRKLIAFTFDDSPAKTLENIFAVFAEYNENNPDCKATATLFVNGGLVTEDSIQTLHAANALGFELGNHTQSHLDLTTLPNEELHAEIDTTDAILSKIDGKKQHLLRPPFGFINDAVKAQTSAPIINWNVDTMDWSKVSAEEIYHSVYDRVSSGAIVLMHDGYPNTVEALKRLLPDLKNAGYQIVSVSALAKAHGCTLKNGGEYVRLRKR